MLLVSPSRRRRRTRFCSVVLTEPGCKIGEMEVDRLSWDREREAAAGRVALVAVELGLFINWPCFLTAYWLLFILLENSRIRFRYAHSLE